jgi:DNA-3-methyladenine glycosylase
MIGKILVRRYRGSLLAGIIVEVEAYHGFDDMASHAYERREGRSAIMYSQGGIAYVYFTYGMYHCLNVVTEHEGYPAAVLIRALEPVAGITTMQRLRGTMQIQNLTNGPGKLCMALNITKSENGISLLSKQLFLTTGKTISPESIGSSRRIGISRSIEHEWRFFLRGNPFVSHQR